MSHSGNSAGCPSLPQGAEPRSMVPSRSRSRRMILVTISTIVAASLGSIGLILLALTYIGDSSGSPSEAISVYYAGIQAGDFERIRDATCRQHQDRAPEAANELTRALVGRDPKLQDIRWTLTGKQKKSRNSYTLTTDTTLIAKNMGTIYSVNKKISFTVVRERGWRVCGVDY